MAGSKKGKAEVIYCTCPTCDTRLIVSADEGDILQSYYEPNEEEAKRKAEAKGAGDGEKEDRKTSSGETISTDKKEAIKEEEETETPEDKGDDNEEFQIGNW